MKELSIEQKAQRYDEALERAESIYNETAIPSATTKGICTYIFPELKESEDERIRKELISHFKETIEIIRSEEIISHDAKVLVGKMQKWIAQLERQGGQKPVWNEEDRKKIIELVGMFESAVEGCPVNFPYRLLKDYIRILKSCIHQTTLKPSEEQIKALEQLEEMHVLRCEKTQENAHLYVIIKSLKEQLKQL